MKIIQAFKLFFKALKDPQWAERALIAQKPKMEKVQADYGHLRLLASMQKAGRLIDFFKEDISGFSDADIGSVARKLHADCAKVLEDIVTIRSIYEEEEGTQVTVPQGFHPSEVKLIGHVQGEPPFRGILRHKGWRAHKLSLPEQVGDHKRDIIQPAEVECI